MKRCLIILRNGAFWDEDIEKLALFFMKEKIQFEILKTGFGPDFRIFNIDSLAEQDVEGIKAELALLNA